MTDDQPGTPRRAYADTGMRLHAGEDWPVPANYYPERQVDEAFQFDTDARGVPVATLRRVGWLDQKGRVWLEVPPSGDFDGGSLTPLLIDGRDGLQAAEHALHGAGDLLSGLRRGLAGRAAQPGHRAARGLPGAGDELPGGRGDLAYGLPRRPGNARDRLPGLRPGPGYRLPGGAGDA